MSSRLRYYHKQKVTEAELNLGFELLERADRDLAADLGIHGIISGAVPTPHEPLANLSIDLTAPARSYDKLGQRIFFGAGQTVDCSVDEHGVPTDVSGPDRERWVAVSLRFDRLLSDPRLDGNSQEIFFRQDESFRVVVHQAEDGPVGAAERPALHEDELLVCEVRRTHGQTQIRAEDIDTSRRQAFVFARSDAVGVEPGLWRAIVPSRPNVQAALDSADSLLAEHLGGTARRHGAEQIDYQGLGFLEGVANLKDALDKLVQDFQSGQEGRPGASRIGADAIPGQPFALTAWTVDQHLSQILGYLNSHAGAPSNAHKASAILATPHSYISGRSVQAQLEELVANLRSTASNLGSTQIGSQAISGSPRNLPAGTVREQFGALLAYLNTHLGSGDHDGRYYQLGSKVADSEKLDGKDSTEFALAGHDHDERYLRRVLHQSVRLRADQARELKVFTEQPHHVSVSYSLVDPNGYPESIVYVIGRETPNLRVWISTFKDNGATRYKLVARNTGGTEVNIVVSAFLAS